PSRRKKNQKTRRPRNRPSFRGPNDGRPWCRPSAIHRGIAATLPDLVRCASCGTLRLARRGRGKPLGPPPQARAGGFVKSFTLDWKGWWLLRSPMSNVPELSARTAVFAVIGARLKKVGSGVGSTAREVVLFGSYRGDEPEQ